MATLRSFDHLSEPFVVDESNNAKTKKTIKCLSISLALTCIAFLAALAGILFVVYEFETGNFSSNDSDSSSSNSGPAGYIKDGPAWHVIFYRMTDQTGITAAKSMCLTLKNTSYYHPDSLPVSSIHCGVQNSIEQVSFGPHGTAQNASQRSLEFGFAFTFESADSKLSVVNSNSMYSNFRSTMDTYRDQQSFSEQGYKGIWLFDWVHGETNRTNLRPHNATGYVKPNSTWHFCFFRWKTDAYAYGVTPTLIDNYRDLEHTMVSPYNSSKKLATSFSFGIQSSTENLSYGPHNGTAFNRSTEYGHVQSYDTFDEKEYMVGANHADRPLFDPHHDLFKSMVGGLWKNASGVIPGNEQPAFFESMGNWLEGVFVFDFTDNTIVP